MTNCSFCDKELASTRTVKKHEKICKKNPESKSQFFCICGSNFSRKDNVINHLKRCSLMTRQQASVVNKWNCQECGSYECNTHKKMVTHLKMFHNVEVDVKIFKFQSILEFNHWKDNEELKSLSYFSKQSGTHGSRTYYYCQHDGSSKAHRKSTEPARLSSRKKKIGQIKKNSKCIARIIVRKEGSSLSVEYYSTHSHPLNRSDLAHQPAFSSALSHSKRQIALNVPPKEIHQSLQTVKFERENRDINSKKDRNLIKTESSIKQRVSKIKKESCHHEDDATYVILGPLTCCEKRHEESLTIPDDLICNISPFLWQIASSTQPNQYYLIEKFDISCSSDSCFHICLELSCLGLCSHSYQCSCSDTYPICKHQHKLHSFLRRGEPVYINNDSDNSIDENTEEMVPSVSIDETSRSNSESETGAYDKLTQNLEKLNKLVEQKNLPLHLLQSSVVILEQLIRRMETEVEPPPLELQTFPEGRKIHSRETLATQESQLLPFKRKKKGNLKIVMMMP